MRALLVVLLLMCMGCGPPAVKVENTVGPCSVELVAEFDGVRVYRVNPGPGRDDLYVAVRDSSVAIK